MALSNKLNINNAAELALEEERLSKKRAQELFDQGLLDTIAPGTFDSLAKIHEYLFQDIYDFAGQIRTHDISKGNFRFASALYLREAVSSIDAMPQQTFEEIVKKYIEMNVAHPFREGNGRSMRIWLDQILKHELGQVVDWSLVDKEDYLLAMERSPIKDVEIRELLRKALTNNVDDRQTYMKGIDASYAYEGYAEFSATDNLN